MSTFNDKQVLIFGGAKGIGRAVAMEFARRGSVLAVADIDYRAAEQTVADIRAMGKRAIAIACDVTSDDSVNYAACYAEETIGTIDIVVNNVGVLVSGNPEDIPVSEWQRIIDLNLMPVVRSNATLLKKMSERGSGHIVNTASFAGLYPYAANRMPYVASKAAVVALTESMAICLIPQGVSVSCFCPGPVMTEVTKNMKVYSDNVPMYGPGDHFDLMTAEQAATVLADGMEAGRIMIATHESVWDTVAAHAANPDQFINDKIVAFQRGEMGLPTR